MEDAGLNLVRGGDGWAVEEREGRGRCLVATRQLEVGDLVLEEQPAVLGPRQLSPVCCLGCCRPLRYADITWCPECSLPLCSLSCPGREDIHRPECELLSRARDMLALNSERDVQQVYYFLTILRALWLRDAKPAQWFAINRLMSNLEERRGTKVFFFNQTYVVETLQHFGILEFSEEEIQTICGIFDSNAFESCETGKAACRGLFLASSLINSSCLPNTRHYSRSNGSLVVVATRPIYPGGEILGCYTQPRWGTLPRHKHLLNTKYFSCSCPRCLDPAECGSLSSALRCPNESCPGPVLPSASPTLPAAKAEDWVCTKCSATVARRRVLTVQSCGAQMVHARDPGPEALLALLEKLLAWFHPSHYTVAEVKMAAVKEWGEDLVPHSSLSEHQLNLKLGFCDQLERDAGLIEGDMSRTKAFVTLSALRSLDYMKGKGFGIAAEHQKKIVKMKKDLSTIFKDDAGAPTDFDVFLNL